MLAYVALAIVRTLLFDVSIHSGT